MDMHFSAIEKILERIKDIELRQEIGGIINILLEQYTNLNPKYNTLRAEYDNFVKQYHSMLEQNRFLQDRVSLLERQLFGSKSEKHSSINNNEALVATETSKTTEVAVLFDTTVCDEITIAETTQEINYKRNKPSRDKRGRFDASTLAQRIEIHDLADSEKFCNNCHKALEHIGNDESRQVESIPAQHILVKHICCKYSCRSCNTIISGTKEVSAIPKAMVGNSVIAQVVVDKYINHLPIYRQAQIYTRQGVIVDDLTIGRWVMQLRIILEPLSKALWKDLLKNSYLQVDETPTLCLESKKKCYMWVYAAFKDRRPNIVIYDFQMTRGQIAVNTKLRDFKGIAQTDGYGGYNTLRKREDIIGIGCGAHIRRKFEAVNHLAEGKAPVANKVLEYFKELYTIEADIKQSNLNYAECKDLREKRAQPIIDELHSYLTELLPQVPPKSAIGKAISYALDEWEYWAQYVNNGEAFIDTNWVENQIRPFGVGRRNWLFIGNQNGGETSALLYSLTQSAKLNNLDPWKYIFYILNHVHDLRKGLIKAEDLLPHKINQNVINNFALSHVEKFSKILHEEHHNL